MHKINRAIIMAAGIGSRMQPITTKIPKPLVKVNGERIIDTIIKALHKNDIFEIYIVVGYLKEKFKVLEEEYQGVKLIYNPYYERCNNISSLYVTREYLENTIILDGDLIIYNTDILSSEFENTCYNCIWTNSKTNEWLLTVEDGFITSCNRNGGSKGWELVSISRWSSSDGKKLKKHLEIEFENKKNYEIYWDDIALFCYPNDYKISIKEMSKTDVIEVDSINELIELDKSYQNYLDEEIENEKNIY